MARRHWCRRLPPVSLGVECQGAWHRVLWRAGRLVVPDHDVPAESGLIALGASPCPCLVILRSWKAIHREAGLGPLWDLDGIFGVRPTWRVAAGRLSNSELPAALQPVAALAALVRAQRRWADPAFPNDDRRRLRHFLASRLREAVDEALVLPRLSRPHAQVAVVCEVAPAEEGVGLETTGDTHLRHLRITVPLSWLVDVWARGLSRVDDLVVLDTKPQNPSGSRLDVLALRFELRGLYGLEPRLVSVGCRRHPGEGWRVDTEEPHPDRYGLVGI